MAVAYRAHARADTGGSAGTSLTINKPTGTAEDDILVAFIYSSDGTDAFGSVTVPSGWTAVGSIEVGGGGNGGCWRKVAGASEGSSYTWSNINSSHLIGVIGAYSGGDTTTPIHKNAQTNGSIPVSTSVTTTNTDCLGIAWSAADLASSQTFSSTEGMTERLDETESGTNLGHALYDEAWATAQAYSREIDRTGSGSSILFLLALNEGGTDATATPGVISTTTSVFSPGIGMTVEGGHLPYIRMTGTTTAANYLHGPATDISGDAAIVLHLELEDWQTGGGDLISRWHNTSGNRSWAVTYGSGNLNFLSADAPGSGGLAFSVAIPGGWSANSRRWIKFELSDDGDGTGTGKFFSKDTEGDSWTQEGSNLDIVAAEFPPSTGETTLTYVGHNPNHSGATVEGQIHRVIVYNNGTETTGTVVLDLNPNDIVDTTLDDGDTWVSSGAGGETWTVEKSATGTLELVTNDNVIVRGTTTVFSPTISVGAEPQVISSQAIVWQPFSPSPDAYINFPGTNQWIDTPDAAALDVTNHEAIYDLACDDWTADSRFFIKWQNSTGARAYQHGITPTGLMTFASSGNGNNGLGVNSSEAIPAWARAAGARLELRYVADTSGSDGAIDFYWRAPGETTWRQVGTTQTISSTYWPPHASTWELNFGIYTQDNSLDFVGKLYRARLYNAASGGSVVADVNPADISDTTLDDTDSWTSSGAGGETWTVDGTGLTLNNVTVTATPGLISGTSTVYTPAALVSDATATPGVVSGSTTVFAPSPFHAHTATPGVISGTTTIFAPTPDASTGTTVEPGLISGTTTVHAPTPLTVGTATPARISCSSSVFTPSLVISGTASPSIILGGGTVTEVFVGQPTDKIALERTSKQLVSTYPDGSAVSSSERGSSTATVSKASRSVTTSSPRQTGTSTEGKY